MFNPERPPEISAQRWLNSDKKRSLKSEKGKVIVVAIWQLTCPGSQKYGLPQAMRLRRAFDEKEVAVFGLHMAFEKFAEQSPEKVEAYPRGKRHHHSGRARQAGRREPARDDARL